MVSRCIPDCPRKKGTEKFYKWYKEQYKQYNDDEIEIPIQAMTKDEQQDPIRTTWCREERNKTVTEVSFKCEYCGKTFVSENSPAVHICEKKRRHLAKDTKQNSNLHLDVSQTVL